MSDKHGYRESTLELDNAAGTLTDLTTDLTDITLNINNSEVDLGTIGDDWDQFRRGSKNWSIDLSGVSNDTAPQTLSILRTVQGTSVDRLVSYKPFAGVYLYGECFGTRFTQSTRRNAGAAFDATLRGTGTLAQTSVAPT